MSFEVENSLRLRMEILESKNAELETVISGYEDTINERDRENAVLKAQMVAVNRWATQVGNGHFNFDPVCPTERLRAVLSSTVAPLAVVDATICGPDNDPEMMMDNFVCVDVDVERGSRVTVVVLPKEGE